MPYTSKKRTVKKREMRKRKILFVLFSLFFLLVLTVFVMRMSWIQIETVLVFGNNDVSRSTIVNEVNTHTRGSYAGIIPKTNILLLNTEKISKIITNSHSEISSTDIKKKDLQVLEIHVVERDDTYLFCQKEDCFSVDGSNYIFKKSGRNTSDSNYFFTSYKQYAIDDTLLEFVDLQELDVLIQSLEIKELNIVQVKELSPFTIGLVTKGGTVLLVEKSDNFDEIYSTIVKLLQVKDFSVNKGKGEFEKNYAYINLQFKNKIFSCLKGEACVDNYK